MMKMTRMGISGILFSTLMIVVPSYAANWVLTPNSNVGFQINSMGISVLKAKFNRVQSNLSFDADAPQNASTRFSMDVNSLSLDKPSMRNMVLGEDSFYAAKYPTVSFKSTSVKSLGNNKYQILGQLTLRGVTKTVTFNTTMKASPTQPKRMDVQSSTTINRSDFGMKRMVGGIGDRVNIQVNGQWQMQ